MIKTYIGIADAHGLESFFHLDDADAESDRKKFLQLRASLNRQRHACFYELTLNQFESKLIQKLLDNRMCKSALRILKQFPKIKIERSCKNSWELIPNSKLDPWYSGELDEEDQLDDNVEPTIEFKEMEPKLNV